MALSSRRVAIRFFLVAATLALQYGPIYKEPKMTTIASSHVRPIPLSTSPKDKIVVAAFCLSIFLVVLDAVTIGNALPAITEGLQATGPSYAWVGSAYNMAWAALLLTWAKMSDIFGRKPIVLLGLAMFVIGSIVAALARSIQTLIAGRAVQGLGAGASMATTSVCITDMFSLRNRALFYSISGATQALGAIVGPLIGGAFADFSGGGWRGIFWLNLPLTAVAALLITLFYHPHNPRTPIWSGIRSVDWLGTVLVAGAATMLLLALNFGGTIFSWSSTTVLSLLVFSAVSFALFWAVEAFVADVPIMPTRCFRSRTAVALLAIAFLHGIAYISCIFYLPIYFQAVLGATAVQSGVWLLAGSLASPFVVVLSGLIMKRTGFWRRNIWAGCIFLTLTFGLFVDFPTYRSWPRIVMFQVVMAIGLAPLFQAPLLALQATLRQEDSGAANALLLFVRTLGSAIGIIAGQAVLQNYNDLSASIFQKLGQTTSGFAGMFVGGEESQRRLVEQAVTHAFRAMWIMFAAISGLTLFACCFLKHQELLEEHDIVQTGLSMDNARKLRRGGAADF